MPPKTLYPRVPFSEKYQMQLILAFWILVLILFIIFAFSITSYGVIKWLSMKQWVFFNQVKLF